jgi:hypothetical protein
MDNLFTSVQLMKHLERHGLHGCGTVRTNRKGYPAALKDFKPPRQGDSKMLQSGNLLACAWRDKKVVNVLATNADPAEQHEALRRQKDGQRAVVPCPDPIHNYQQYMRGVDICDQLRGKYSVGRPCKKWWRYLLYFLMSIAVVNGYLTMKSSGNVPQGKRRYRQVDFRVNLAQQLIGGYNGYKRKGCDTKAHIGATPLTAQALPGHMFVSLLDQKKRSYCKVHSKRDKERKDTIHGCSKCMVHLCSQACHTAYHNHLMGHAY